MTITCRSGNSYRVDQAWDEGLAVSSDVLAAIAAAVPIVGGTVAGFSQAIVNHELRKRLSLVEAVVERYASRLNYLEDTLQKPEQRETFFMAMAVAHKGVGGDMNRLWTGRGDVVADGFESNMSGLSSRTFDH